MTNVKLTLVLLVDLKALSSFLIEKVDYKYNTFDSTPFR